MPGSSSRYDGNRKIRFIAFNECPFTVENYPLRFTDPTGLDAQDFYYMLGEYSGDTDAISAISESYETIVADTSGRSYEVVSEPSIEKSDYWDGVVFEKKVVPTSPAVASNINAGKQAARAGALVTSAVEVGIGITLLPPPTTPFGIAMVAHGGANTIAAAGSLYAYNSSNGKTELPTSALGMAAYLVNANDPYRAAAVSSMVDLADDIGGALLSPQTAPGIISTISAANFAFAQGGNLYLGVTSAMDLHLWGMK
jgi:hypothetical protein